MLKSTIIVWTAVNLKCNVKLPVLLRGPLAKKQESFNTSKPVLAFLRINLKNDINVDTHI